MCMCGLLVWVQLTAVGRWMEARRLSRADWSLGFWMGDLGGWCEWGVSVRIWQGPPNRLG